MRGASALQRRSWQEVLSAGFLCVLVLGAATAAATPPPIRAVNPPQGESFLVGYDQRAEVRAFIDDMVATHGFAADELAKVFARASYNNTVAGLMGPTAAAKSVPWSEYRSRFVEPQRIEAGVRFWQAHALELSRAEQTYGVPARIIVGILGVETLFGRNTGNFRILDALTTLAFDYPNKDHDRSAFFREQLADFLLLAREDDLDVFGVRGSYAGAIGMPQFMPSSILHYAVDFDGDGSIDLRTSAGDAIGSVANFLASQGWQRDAPILYGTGRTSDPSDPALLAALVAAGSEPHLEAPALQAAGLSVPPELAPDEPVTLVDLPDGENPTVYFIGLANFHVLTRYNRSYAYAVTVVQLGDAIHARIAQLTP